MSTLRARIAATAIVGSLAVAVAALIPWPSRTQAQPEPVVEPAPTLPEPEPEPRFTQVSHKIKRGQALGSILPDYGVHQVDAVVEAALPWVDLRKIYAGKELHFTQDRELGGKTVEMRYVLDEDHTLVVDLSGETPTASVDEVLYTAQPEEKVLIVDGSLWAAAVEAGLRPADIVRIAKVFQYDVDFNTELQAGARFSVIGQALYREDGSYAKMGELQAVRLENKGETFTAIHYVHSDGETDGWYHPDGTASKKPFLRSPLDFARVTSGFSTGRFHPVLKKKRKHLGTDFGCPTGTPVRATGDGVVKVAKTHGGHGKHVVVQHPGGRVTKYSHLSAYKVKPGQSVKQGQVIALSGNTGMSTGPHLHYELHVGGKPVDAMTVKLPNTESIPSSEKSAFNAQKALLVAQLDELAKPQDTGGPALADGGPSPAE